MQFRHRAVEISEILQCWLENYSHIPGLPSHNVDKTIIANLVASRIILEEPFKDAWRQIPRLRQALRSRSTSWNSDGAICLGTIMGLDTRQTIEAEDAQKMRVFWSLVKDIPAGLAFSQASQKLQDKGYRWAPLTLLGDLETRRWGGHLASFMRLDAKATQYGLEVKFPGVLFQASKTGTHDFLRSAMLQRYQTSPLYLVLKDANGHWYQCTSYQDLDWHQTPSLIEFSTEEPAIVFEFEQGSESLSPKRDFDAWNVTDGLLVTYPPSEICSTVLHARAHKHVQVSICSENDRILLDGLKQCYDSFKGYQPRIEEHLRTEGLVQLQKEVLQRHGLRHSDEEALEVCVHRLRYFAEVGPYYEVQQVPESMIWCID